MRTRKLALYLAIALLPLSIIAVIPAPPKASAISSSSWQSGRIIDDSVFFNTNAYSANQVQAFLNAKVPTCDTNGSQIYSGSTTRAQYGAANGSPAPYTCLKNYVTSFSTIAGDEYCPGGLAGGTKSAAQIITEASINCGINPQVMLITLEKEQSLITDQWPWPIQYTKATGYYCPDTADCDPAYAGFVKQVYYGARQLQRYSKRADLFPNYRPGRSSRIYYNQNSGCGYSDVFVQTQATSNLYIYTPYQPNAAVLAAVPGTEVSCGAYGNINFWRKFNDWFGPTIGPLLRTTTSGSLYYSDGTRKYAVSSVGLAEQYNLALSDVRYVSQSELDALPTSSYPFSQVVKSDDDADEDGAALYLISGGKRIQFNDMGTFAAFGFQTSQISYLPLGSIFRLPADPSFVSTFVQAPSQFVYKAESSKKRGVFDPGTYNAANPSGKITKLSNFTLGNIPTGLPFVVGDAILRQSDGKSWLYQDGAWKYIPSSEVYSCWGFSGIKNFTFKSGQATPGSESDKLSCKAELTNGSKYLMNRVNRISHNMEWGFSDFSKPLDRTIQRLSNQNLPEDSVFKSSASTSIYVLENGKRRQVPDMGVFQKLGYSQSNLVTVDPGLLTTIPQGPKKLASGTLLKDSSGKTFVTLGESKLYIPNGTIFNSFGYSGTKVASGSASVLSQYATTTNLQSRFTIGSEAFLVDNKRLLTIQSSDRTHFSITGSTPVYNIYLLSGALSQQNMTRFVKAKTSNTIYYIQNGQKRPISSWNTLVSLGGTNSVVELLDQTLATFPAGSPI